MQASTFHLFCQDSAPQINRCNLPNFTLKNFGAAVKIFVLTKTGYRPVRHRDPGRAVPDGG
jgi:hypothetical protein